MRLDSIGGKSLWVVMACGLLSAVSFALSSTGFPASAADDTVCAQVKIEVKQELALERQAFEAHMLVRNGLAHLALEDVDIDVFLTDEDGTPVSVSSDPGNAEALFFIRLDAMENIDDVAGLGNISPATAADIRWVIIPSPGSSNGLQQGTLYYVGAKLTYTIGGVENVTTVTPDYIFVKPLPNLALDYFLPREIYGDDAFTAAIEPPVPFSLGVRVRNVGSGRAANLKIDSAQPKIVENTQGLLIGFAIDGSEVNGNLAANSLLVDFGDIEPDSSATARWSMSCTLSGQFVSFDARVSHADELGGELTSLIRPENIRTHTLVRDVLVDLPGRDGVRDFLSLDGDIFRVYETDSADVEVPDHSAASSLVFLGQDGGRVRYTLQTPITAGFTFVRLPDPGGGCKVIFESRRSDGKTIKPENIWFSKVRKGPGWEHFINLFDVNTTGAYSLVLDDAAVLPQAPVIDVIPDRTGVENQVLTVLVTAVDPNGTVPALAAEQMPAGSRLTDQGDGTAVFRWTPFAGQAGRYEIIFTATDGSLTAKRRTVLTINAVHDSDGDGLLDAWEIEHFGSLEYDGHGDYDGDGISDLLEFLFGSDPAADDHVPTAPVIEAPVDGSAVTTKTPLLVVVNSSDADRDSLSYQFELYADPGYGELVASVENLPQAEEKTSWTVPLELSENLGYHWRVRATDGYSFSLWSYGTFVVNCTNEPPGAFSISHPRDGARVGTVRPLLEVTNSCDPDHGILTYGFEVYADSALTIPVTSSIGIAAGSKGTTAWRLETALTDGVTYYWLATVSDELDARSTTAVGMFTVDLFYPAPPAPTIVVPQRGAEIAATNTGLTVANVSHGTVVTYFFELDTLETFDSPSQRAISAGTEGITVWPVADLIDNTRYFWRAKAGDGEADSAWATGEFFVNTVNEAPPLPTVHNPGSRAWVGEPTPELAVNPVFDPDGDSLTCRFEVYGDEALMNPVCQGTSAAGGWRVPVELTDNTHYFWRARAEDKHGAAGNWTAASPFFMHATGPGEAPRISILAPSGPLATNAAGLLIQWEDTDTDSSARIALYYDTDAAGADGVLIAGNLSEDPDGPADSYNWDISAIEGSFYLYAIITDGQNSTTVYGAVPVTIDHTPPRITRSPPGGSYTTAQSVTLSTDEAAEIFCTVDGSQPTPAAALYSAPIDIAASTTLNCLAVDDAGNVGQVSETYTIGPRSLTIKVDTDRGRVLAGLKVYVFTANGSYTGKSATTDTAGLATFDPADFSSGDYKVRVDYLGSRFFSVPFSLPEDSESTVIIEEAPAEVAVRFAGKEAEGVKVYLFNAAGAYLGTSRVTDQRGRASFNLPVGIAYSFRADILGNRYWSLSNTIVGGGNNNLALDAGGGRYRITLRENEETPLPEVRLYLFNQAGSYLGGYRTTHSDGTAEFDVPAGTFKVRADYLGYQFWSDETAITTDTTLAFEIPHRDVSLTVSSIYQEAIDPLEGLRTYLFTESGVSQGVNRTTGSDGKVTYHLPRKPYKVRADYLGHQYWSDAFTWDDLALFADPEIRIGMADAEISVSGGGFPVAGENVYVFSPAGSYIGLNQVTETNGKVQFRLPAENYKFRADHQGSQYWSAEEQLTADEINPVGISTGGGNFTITVRKDTGDPLSSVKCSVFTTADAYLNMVGMTDESGRVTFDLATGLYKFRIDYSGKRFWSEVVDVPGDLSFEVTIHHESVEITVLTASGPAAGKKVYLFSDGGAYLGLFKETDLDGKVFFSLPANHSFQFRAKILDHHFWSNPTTVSAGHPNEVSIDAGGGTWRVTVQEQAGTPMAGVTVYLFDEDGGYLGTHRTSVPDGSVSFDVPRGWYKVRADYLGYQFWSMPHLISESTDTLLTIAHRQTHVTLSGLFQGTATPVTGAKVYLYSPTDTYLGIHGSTDPDGKVFFALPQKDYKVRADYLGSRYFSDLFNWNDVSVAVPMADAVITVTGGGFPQTGRKVYVYSDTGAYLGLSQATDDDGQVSFRLPSNTYKFRVDHQERQFWSGSQVIASDTGNPVVISVGGGAFVFTVEKSGGVPLAGTTCAVFNGSGTYIGLSGSTNEQGQVFFDLAEGLYKFRVDHLGYRFWSDEYHTGAALSGALDLGLTDVTVMVEGHFLDTAPLKGLKAYLFTPTGAYLGQQRVTDDNGQVHFSLPAQEYQIRVDTFGNSFWSNVFRQEGSTMVIPQGQAIVHVQRAGVSVDAAKVYLFSESGAYLGRVGTTAFDGKAEFILPNRAFKFRVDKGAEQVWSDVVNVPAGASADVAVDLD